MSDEQKRVEALASAQEILVQARELIRVAEDVALEHDLEIEFMGMKFYTHELPDRYWMDGCRLARPIWANPRDWQSSTAGCEPGALFDGWECPVRIDGRSHEEVAGRTGEVGGADASFSSAG